MTFEERQERGRLGMLRRWANDPRERKSYLLRADPKLLKAAAEKAAKQSVTLRQVLGDFLRKWIAADGDASY